MVVDVRKCSNEEGVCKVELIEHACASPASVEHIMRLLVCNSEAARELLHGFGAALHEVMVGRCDGDRTQSSLSVVVCCGHAIVG